MKHRFFIFFIVVLFTMDSYDATCQVLSSSTNYIRDSASLFSNCVSDSERVFRFVTHDPEFKGALGKFVRLNLETKEIFAIISEKTNKICATVEIEFVVNWDGSLCRLQYLYFSDLIFRDVILELLMLSPDWQPGSYDGARRLNVFKCLKFDFTIDRKKEKVIVEYCDFRKAK